MTAQCRFVVVERARAAFAGSDLRLEAVQELVGQLAEADDLPPLLGVALCSFDLQGG